MNIRELNKNEVTALYEARVSKDFPRAERKTLKTILRSLDGGVYKTLGLIDDDGAIAGYAFFVRCEGNYMLDYLATLPERRNGGLGGKFLKLLDEYLKNAHSMILEVEDPAYAKTEDDRALQTRRIGFYLRNGMIDTGVTAVTYGVPYKILARARDSELPRDTIRALYRRHYVLCMTEEVAKRMVKV